MLRESKPLSTVGLLADTTLRIVIIPIVLFLLRLAQIHQSPLFSVQQQHQIQHWQHQHASTLTGDDFLFHRREVDRLEQLIAQRLHLYVTGSAGVGKTGSVKEAILQFGNNSISKKVATCYIDLIPLSLVLRGDAPQEVTNSIIKKYLVAQVNEYELQLLKVVHGMSTFKWLTAFLTRHWLGMLTLSGFQDAAAFSTLPQLHKISPDSYGFSAILNHIVVCTEQLNRMFTDAAVLPVLVIDGTQALMDQNLAALNKEVVQLLNMHLPLKRSAKLTVILISSDNGDGNTRLAELKYSAQLYHEIVGDLSRQEARDCLLYLNTVYHSREAAVVAAAVAAARTTAASAKDSSSSSGGNQKNSEEEVWDAEAAAAALQLHILSSRLYTRVSNEKDFDAIYTRYGGYIPDLTRFARTQHDTPEEDISISDRSKIHFLAQNIEFMIPQMDINAKHLLTLYRTLLEMGKSVRACVLLSELVDIIEIPESEIHTFGKLGLVEIREANPGT